MRNLQSEVEEDRNSMKRLNRQDAKNAKRRGLMIFDFLISKNLNPSRREECQ